MNDMLNPYIAGAPVVETSMFFGREDVFGWIERSLEGKFVNHILVLHGQRRVGKTSVLKQIPNFLPEKYIQVFFDLQGRTGTTLDRFLWWLASEIVRALKREHDINIPKPDRKAFEDTEYLINEFLPGLRPALSDHVLLLTFDEFDSLDRSEIQEKLSRPLIAYLRRLIEVEGLNFIFSIGSSGDKLENMQASYTEFFKSALYRKISFLTGDDCQRLVTKPVEGVIKYEKKAVSRISEITSGHPYFIQLTCHELFSRCQKTGARVIKADDVEAVLEDVVERGTVNLKFVWDEASDLEKWILATLAQMDGGDNQELAQALTAQRVRFSEADLNSAVIHLRDKDVITGDNRFVIHLMRLWLVANRPTDRVREELVEINPIANRFIEIGDEYRDRGDMRQAIEYYQQALNVNPGDLIAQTNIASVHLEQKDYEQAAAAFALALKIDDEDVVAKTGYCDANLALGDAARGRGEDSQALALYQKILVINAAHTDARQRSAAIYRERAERQLAAGQDDEALQSFNQVMDFMPDDDELSTRYHEILAQKKAKLVSKWLGKAEQAAEAENWDEAVEAWKSYLALRPDDGAQVEENIHHAQKYARIAGDYAEAQEAIHKKRYGKAIELLQGIIIQEPSYKSTSRLLVEAVESNKAIPFWRRPWALTAAGTVGLAVIGVFFGPQAWNAISAAIADRPAAATEAAISVEPMNTPDIKKTEPAEIALEPTITLEPTVTAGPISPTPTAMPLPTWATEFSEPILAAIAAHEPTFQDDFSSEVWGWYGSPFSIEAGVMRLGEAGGSPANLYIDEKRNFVFQVDVSPPSPANPEVLVAFNSPQDWGHQFSLRPGGWTACNTRNTDGCTESSWGWPEDRKVQITVIMKATQAGFYLDGSPVAHLSDPEFTLGGWNFGCESSCEIDNVKFWDLDVINIDER